MKILVISSQVSDKREIDFNGSTAGELKQALIDSGIDMRNKKMVNIDDGVSYASDEAPVTSKSSSLTIYISPAKTKSGASYSELKAQAKEAFASGNYKEIFDSFGKPYSRMTTNELEQLINAINSHQNNNQASAAEVSDIVESVDRVVKLEARVLALEKAITELRTQKIKPEQNSWSDKSLQDKIKSLNNL